MGRNNKKSLIGGIVALSMILTGTGYAYWTDTLNITTKATTGDMEVTFVDLGLYAQYGNEKIADGGWSIVDGIEREQTNGFVSDGFFERGTSDYNTIAKEGSIEAYVNEAEPYNHVTFDAELVEAEPIKSGVPPYLTANTNGSDRISIEINNMYPGYAQAFRTDILNAGTIAAKLSDIKFGVEGEELTDEAKGMLGIAILIDKEAYDPAEENSDVFKLAALLQDKKNSFTIGGVDFVRLSVLNKLDDRTIEAIENANLLAYPGSDNRMDLFIAVGMDPDAEGNYTTGTATNIKADKDDAQSQLQAATVTIDLAWGQFNEGVEAESSNRLEKQNMGR